MFKKLLSLGLSFAVLLLSVTPFAAANTETPYKATVKITSYQWIGDEWVEPYALGSGTIIRNDGIILTNSHVVLDDDEEPLSVFEICLTSSPSEEPECGYTASLIDWDEDMDVALLKMDLSGNQNVSYLSYKNAPSIEIEDAITVYGYPFAGGETLTSTQGQVSGFETINDFQYIKTDAYFSWGSSGGTVVDESGNFLGIPTYGVFNLGYFLDIHEAESWIEEHIDQDPQVDEVAKMLMQNYLEMLNEFEDNNHYVNEAYPSFEIVAPEESSWEIFQARPHLVTFYEEKEDLAINFVTALFPFEFNDAYFEATLKEIEEEETKWADDYGIEDITFQGNEGKKLIIENWGIETHIYLIPYGYGLFQVTYMFESDDSNEKEDIIHAFLDGFQFLEEPSTAPEIIETYESTEPNFSINRTGDWFIKEEQEVDLAGWYEYDNSERTLIYFLRPDDPDVEFEISVQDKTSDQKTSTNEVLLQEAMESTSRTVLVSNPHVIMDGLNGWSYVYTYTNSDDEEMKGFRLYIPYSEEQLLYIEYVDVEDNYKERIEEIKSILQTFRHESPDYLSTGEFDIGSLEDAFSDMRYHRYEQRVMELYNQGLVKGYPDKSFQPEREINRAEALKIILSAHLNRKYEEDEEAITAALEAFMGPDYKLLSFSDTPDHLWYTKYVRYARHHGYISGYTASFMGEFHPEETVTLAETLSLLFKVFEVPYWKSDSGRVIVNWRKPLMDKAYDMYLIPNGMDDPDRNLTRAEFCAVVSKFLDGWK